MASMATPIRVTMESGETWDVVADQRDYYRWEKTGRAVNDPLHLVEMARFLAWCASVREGHTDLTWKKFDLELVSADESDVDESDVDPTRPTQ